MPKNTYLCAQILNTFFMKTKFSLLFAMLFSFLCITFTSCSDDDDETVNYAKEIAGTYKGDISPEGSDEVLATDATITFTRNSDKNVTLKVDQTIADLPINVECTSDVTYTAEKYHIDGTTEFKMGDATYPVNVTGSIDQSGNATINIAIPLLDTRVVYNGKKQ